MNKKETIKKAWNIYKKSYCLIYLIIVGSFWPIYSLLYTDIEKWYYCGLLFLLLSIFTLTNLFLFEEITNINRRRWLSIISGLLTITGSMMMFYKEYDFLENCADTNDKMMIIMRLMIFSLILLLGIIHIYINIPYKWLTFVITVVGVILIGVFQMDLKLLLIPLIIGVSFGIYFTIKKFIFEFSVITTFVLYTLLAIVFYYVIAIFLPAVLKIGMTYLFFTFILMGYMYFGTKINKWFIKKIDNEQNAHEFDYSYLKNDIFFIYLIVFVSINAANIDSFDKDFIDNVFLIGLAIIQVDWNKLLRKNKIEFPITYFERKDITISRKKKTEIALEELKGKNIFIKMSDK